jgi:phosphoglycerate dehydrogenase-like enzyme
MATPSIAILDPFHPKIIETIRSAIPADWRLSIAEGPDFSEQAAAIRDADMVFVMATPMPRKLLQEAPKLRFIQKLGAGVDRIDTAFCTENNIAVARLHAGNAIPVAEHTMMLILSAYRHLPMLDRQTRAGEWGKEGVRGINKQVHGKTVGLVGFGAIGRQLAKLLSGFGVDLAYYDPMRAPEAVEAEFKARYLPLDDLIAQADIISLHLPLMPETAGLINEERIAAMKPHALIVNCARGGLVDETALAKALSERRIFGAALDAFSKEPPVGSPLLNLENTVVTPHCAGATIDNFASIAERATANAKRFLAGEPLPAGDVVVEPS